MEHVTPDAIAGGSDVGQSLSELLDRLEPEHSHVVLAGGLLEASDPWTQACLKQADRVLLTVETSPDAAAAAGLGRSRRTATSSCSGRPAGLGSTAS